jgi:hypothetical protein
MIALAAPVSARAAKRKSREAISPFSTAADPSASTRRTRPSRNSSRRSSRRGDAGGERVLDHRAEIREQRRRHSLPHGAAGGLGERCNGVVARRGEDVLVEVEEHRLLVVVQLVEVPGRDLGGGADPLDGRRREALGADERPRRFEQSLAARSRAFVGGLSGVATSDDFGHGLLDSRIWVLPAAGCRSTVSGI